MASFLSSFCNPLLTLETTVIFLKVILKPYVVFFSFHAILLYFSPLMKTLGYVDIDQGEKQSSTK